MRALVVYESMFGSTQEVARAVGEGVAAQIACDVLEVGAAPDEVPADVALLVVGAPTHAFGVPNESTRRSAEEQATGPLVSTGRGVREWLDGVRADPARTSLATFDTRVRQRWVPGSAAAKLARRLRSDGFTVVGGPETFRVDGMQGGLLPGEVDRARAWGAALASQVPALGPPPPGP